MGGGKVSVAGAASACSREPLPQLRHHSGLVWFGASGFRALGPWGLALLTVRVTLQRDDSDDDYRSAAEMEEDDDEDDAEE